MAAIKNWGRSRSMLHLFIIKLVFWLGWLFGHALGQVQLSEAITGFVSFHALGIACIGNLAVFYISILRGRLESEIGAKYAVATLTGKTSEPVTVGLFRLGWGNLTTCVDLHRCSVVMLSSELANRPMHQFMEYVSKAYGVHSIFLQCDPVVRSVLDNVEICNPHTERCGCIVFQAVEEIKLMLARRIPRTVKTLDGSLCLLPSLKCLTNGCHGCNHGLLYVETDGTGRERLREGDFIMAADGSPAAACEILDWMSILDWMPLISNQRRPTCICIPVHPASNDEWTKRLIRFFKRPRATSTSYALENYMDRDGECSAIEEYGIPRLLIVPRLTEVLINLALTFWFKVDGFSSALVARRALKDYLVDSKVSGFYAHVFLTQAIVKSNATYTNVCQVLFFRRALLTASPLYHLIGVVNASCSISWILLIALEGGANKWYHTHSMSPSEARVVVIMAAIGIALIMDCIDLILYLRFGGLSRFGQKVLMICAIIVLEMLCIVSGSAVLRVLGIKIFGRWIYGALQGLVWLKWGIGTYFLEHYLSREEIPPWSGNGGLYIYASAFWLNAILAGVRAQWDYS